LSPGSSKALGATRDVGNKREDRGVANSDRRFSDVGKIPAALALKGKDLIWNSGTLEQTPSHHQKW
jgi:hypothetical protein